MANINDNFLKLQDNYLFSTIAKKVNEFKNNNPDKKIIKMGIGDVTLPIPKVITDAMQKAAQELEDINTFKGYPPEYGYSFLKEKIIENDYKKRNINIDESEIFISDGAKSDTGNILDIFKCGNTVAITNPVYPVYMDTNIMMGNKIVYIPMSKENNFIPQIPKEKVDIIYLCFPNNPTGVSLGKRELQKWIDYAIENNSIIIYDAAYEAFITEEDIVHSIYEIDGAKKVAIEFKSFSKTAGFTGIRCGYTVVPKEVIGFTKTNEKVNLNKLWARRQSTKFNGVSYITQIGAEAVYSDEGKIQTKKNVNFYMENAKIIKNELKKLGFGITGGVNAPYIWLKTPDGLTSWEFFEYLLNEKQIVGTPRKRIWNRGRRIF